MARKLEVEIVGDARSLHKALNESSNKTSRFGSVLSTLKTGAIGAGAAVAGGLVVGLEKSIHAAIEAEVVNKRLDVAFRNAGLSAKKYAGQVEELESAGRKLGFTDEQTKTALGSLITATKNMDQATRSLAIAQDLARFKNVSLEQATKALTMAHAGSTRALKQLGIDVPKVTDAVDKLKASTKKHTGAVYENELAQAKLRDKAVTYQHVLEETTKAVHGQAAAYSQTAAGAMEQFRAQLSHIEVAIGEKLLPAMQEAVVWLRDHWPEISAAITKFWADVQPGLQAFVDIMKSIVGYIQDNWGTIGPIVSGVGTAVGDGLKLMLTPLQLIADILKGDWSKLWSDFAAAPVTFIKGIKALFEPIGKAIKKALVAGLAGIGSEAWDSINNIGDFLKTKLAAIIGWGSGIAGNIIDGYVSALAAIGGKTWDAVKGIGDFIATKAAAVTSWGLAIGKGVLNGIIDGISGVGKAVAAQAQTIAKEIANAVIDLLNDVIDKINSALEFDIPLPFGKSITVNPKNIPHIPHLAAGGALAAGQAAVIGEKGPELFVPGNSGTVIPNNQLSRPMIVNLTLDGKSLAQVLIDPLRGEARIYKQQTGKAAFA